MIVKDNSGLDTIKVGGSIKRVDTSRKSESIGVRKFNLKPSITPKAIKIEHFMQFKEAGEIKTNAGGAAVTRDSIDREKNKPP